MDFCNDVITEEMGHGLWRVWKYGLSDLTLDQRKRCIKHMVKYYWELVEKDYTKSVEGCKVLIDLFLNINFHLQYRMLTEARMQIGLFCPHLVDRCNKSWGYPNDIMGLPGRN